MSSKLFLVIFLFSPFGFLLGQKFSISDPEPLIYKNHNATNAFQKIYLIQNGQDTLDAYDVYAEEIIEKKMEKLVIPDLHKISTILKVKISQSECCTSTETYYYFISKDHSIRKLNPIHNVYCDGPTPYYDLVFPQDKFGKKGKVYLGRFIFDETYHDWPYKLTHIQEIMTINPENLVKIR